MTKQPNKITEVYEVLHKGIIVGVRIDYIKNEITILENPVRSSDTPKSWVFAKRGVEFMDAWLNILDAIKFAIVDAKKKYESELAEQSKFTEIGALADIPVFVFNKKVAKKVVKKNK